MSSAKPSPSDSAMSARTAFWRKTLTDLAIMTVIGVFLAIIGPFGSINEPLPMRLLSWVMFALLGYAIYSPMGYLVDRAHEALDLPLGPLWFFAALVASVPMTALVYTVQYFPRAPVMPRLEEGLTSFFYVFVIGGGITLLFNVLGRSRSTKGEASQPTDTSRHIPADPIPAPAPANPLIDALPVELGSDVIALEMEDHYVRVHTALGSGLMLMRLRDAMAHLTDVEGRQVHRSWWVARGAVEDVRREGRNVRLVLARGIEAPVSRAQVSELKEVGWL